MRMNKVSDAGVIVIGLTLIWGCSATQGTNQAFPPPKLPPGYVPEEQRRQAQAQQDLQNAFEQEMQRRGWRLHLEITARPKKQAGTRVQATRCGEFFLYYDHEFINGNDQAFFPRSTRTLRSAHIPFGFTVSYTPPDAAVDWIDEIETGTYSVAGNTTGLLVLSRGRKIPRGKVVPVPFSHSRWWHAKINIRGVPYGEGAAYEYVE